MANQSRTKENGVLFVNQGEKVTMTTVDIAVPF